jgi:hypothetical protein
MAEEDESEKVDIIDADALFAAMMAETEEERADRQVRSDALEAAKAEKEDADRQQQSRDIWWLFHHELTHKATKVSRAAQALSDAIGEVSKVDPDEEVSRIRAILAQKTIENDLEEFRDHFQKMEELLKSVRTIQDRIFGDASNYFVVPDPRITTVGWS